MTTSTPSSRRGDAGAEGAAGLAERLGHTFVDITLLHHALAHRSWCGEQEGGAPSNERLEFLGDAVLVAHECATRGVADHVAAAVRSAESE